jgi:hypothetical protein
MSVVLRFAREGRGYFAITGEAPHCTRYSITWVANGLWCAEVERQHSDGTCDLVARSTASTLKAGMWWCEDSARDAGWLLPPPTARRAVVANRPKAADNCSTIATRTRRAGAVTRAERAAEWARAATARERALRFVAMQGAPFGSGHVDRPVASPHSRALSRFRICRRHLPPSMLDPTSSRVWGR